ncbi:DPOL [Hepatospora eriocheir]|uniref:DNA-directed DNA polymerase n=1 Tax=Hepatospora eriocheir TaxID=1081669 RepID=A0A1X0Q8D5_9MICR|nr:DPOL [Hepatospora eriocheir]
MLSNNVLDIIFNYNSASDTNLPQLVYDYCIKYYNNLENLSKNDYVISSILNKPIEMYDKDSQYPHVNMAIRLRKLGFNYQQNDVVNYVIGAGSGPVSRRGYLVNEDFEVDYDYYIKTQLIPPLYRIVDLIKSIRVDKISAIFGISTINIPKEVSKIKFVLDCCGSYEVPTDKCSKCDKEVSEEFYKIAVQRLLHQKVNYKDHYGECLVCNIKYSNMATSCLKCEKNLFFNFKNKEFDTLLSNIQNTFYENKIINEICDFYSEKSSYRVINLGDYFSNEFKRK